MRKLWVGIMEPYCGIREATPDDIRAAFIEQCEASGIGKSLRLRQARLDAEADRQERAGGDPTHSWGSAGTLMFVLDDLGLSVLLEEPKPEAPA